MDIGINKDLLKDKANLSINFRNILDSRIQDEITIGDNYISESTRKRIGRRVSATFTYRFNRKKNEGDRLRGQ